MYKSITTTLIYPHWYQATAHHNGRTITAFSAYREGAFTEVLRQIV